MSIPVSVMDNLRNTFENPTLYTTTILTVLFVVLLLSVYEFGVYRLVSHRAFYNKSFNISIAIIPFFISTIILCLQSNLVITLGTIGALAIIRFRTAIKDPVDMIYILWSIHIGITCGCQLYEVAILTSIVVTVVLFVMENVTFGSRPFVLVAHCEAEKEKVLFEILKETTKKHKIKSRNWTAKGMDYVVEFTGKSMEELTEKLREGQIERFSIIEYDCDDIV